MQRYEISREQYQIYLTIIRRNSLISRPGILLDAAPAKKLHQRHFT